MMVSTQALLVSGAVLQVATLAYAARGIRAYGMPLARLALSSMALLLVLRSGFLLAGGALPGLQASIAAEVIALILSSKLLLGLALLDRETKRSAEATAQLRTFLRDVLASVTEGKLRFCDSAQDLPARLTAQEAVEPLALTSVTLRQLRRRLAKIAEICDLSSTRGFDLLLAGGEAAMNAVVHGSGGTARIHCDPQKGQIQLWIEDRGTGIALDRLPRATLERGYSSAGSLGQGFPIMLQASDRVYLATGPNGTTTVIEISRENGEVEEVQDTLAVHIGGPDPEVKFSGTLSASLLDTSAVRTARASEQMPQAHSAVR